MPYTDIVIDTALFGLMLFFDYRHLKGLNALTWQNFARQLLDDIKWPVSMIMIFYGLQHYGTSPWICTVLSLIGSRIYWKKIDNTYVLTA